jgi:hypothetical protein
MDDVGVLSQGRVGRNVKSAHVQGVYALAIWEPGNDGFVCGMHVGHGGSVPCCARVKDGPCLYGIHVDIDSL